MKAPLRSPQHSAGLLLALMGLMTGFIAPGYCQDGPVSALSTKALATLPTWIPTGILKTPRVYQTATLLPNGKVLAVGGLNENANILLDSAELYDITTGTWSVTGSLSSALAYHTATLLQNGKVLVVWSSAPFPHSNAALYDPATETWSPTSGLDASYSEHTATLLPNGKVLIVGGVAGTYFLGSVYRADLYDPDAGTWGPAGSPTLNHSGNATATLLQNGNVLVAGGSAYPPLSEDDIPVPRRAELYDPVSDSWREVGTAFFIGTATLLANGKVLMVGGRDIPSSVKLYDPAAETFIDTGNLTVGRFRHTATLLPNGKVLVAGGYGADLAELYDPDSAMWTRTSSLNARRSAHTATLLPNGNVLVAGGTEPPHHSLNSAELYGDVSLQATVPLIEYFHAAFGHYFITSILDEISKLDNGIISGWARTGLRFNAYAAAGAGALPVCRFFSTAFAPKSSHFYTPFPVECATVQANPNWSLESAAAFYVGVPGIDGSCVAGLTPVYRLYNNGQGAAPNHRYTTDFTVRAQMIAQGWVPEGLGPDAVEMCSPL